MPVMHVTCVTTLCVYFNAFIETGLGRGSLAVAAAAATLVLSFLGRPFMVGECVEALPPGPRAVLGHHPLAHRRVPLAAEQRFRFASRGVPTGEGFERLLAHRKGNHRSVPVPSPLGNGRAHCRTLPQTNQKERKSQSKRQRSKSNGRASCMPKEKKGIHFAHYLEVFLAFAFAFSFGLNLGLGATSASASASALVALRLSPDCHAVRDVVRRGRPGQREAADEPGRDGRQLGRGHRGSVAGEDAGVEPVVRVVVAPRPRAQATRKAAARGPRTLHLGQHVPLKRLSARALRTFRRTTWTGTGMGSARTRTTWRWIGPCIGLDLPSRLTRRATETQLAQA
mmetsp:Transcript_5976/g.15202  ORF Transcript_5976/g.15202 Transcript_5976/m.15202 type:complete len:340 (-) Transcript_5976:374-1393(-)